MLHVHVFINGDEIGSVDVHNRGPIAGTYKYPDKPGGGGLRNYEWVGRFHGEDESRHGTIQHLRSNGAAELVAAVFAQISDAKWMDE